MYSLSFELVYGAFFAAAAAVDYYVYYTMPCFFLACFCLRFSYRHLL